MSLKLLRTIRLDPSDTFVFEQAAEPGEWAVSGAFLFAEIDIPSLPPKRRAAFRQGFLGADSLGFSTLAVVTPATPEEFEAGVAILARRFVERLGAPSFEAAMEAARAEFEHAASVSDHPEQTLVALQRTFEDGAIGERFRTLTPRADRPKDSFRAFEFFEVEDETPEERVDLLALRKGG